MSTMAKLTDRLVKNLAPSDRDQFYRCSELVGFGVKVTPAGRKSFFAEGRVRGQSQTRRKALGTFPSLSVKDAKVSALKFLGRLQEGVDPVEEERRAATSREFRRTTVGDVFEQYLEARSLRPRTEYDYKSVMRTVFEYWLEKPIAEINRGDVREKFLETRGLRGKPTANKAFRVLSALFVFASAIEKNGEQLISTNPVLVLKQSRMMSSTRRRTRYLSEAEVRKLINFDRVERDWPETPQHGVTDQGMNFVRLLLFTGLRRSEALGIRWEDVNFTDRLLIARDTKNHTDHTVPMSPIVSWTLRDQKRVAESSEWVFPAKRGNGHMVEPRFQIKAISDAIGVPFTAHDLRRTFATHASSAGIDFENIRRALNHSAGSSVTAGYIIQSAETMRSVFEKVFEVYSEYYDPNEIEDFLTPEEGEVVTDETPRLPF